MNVEQEIVSRLKKHLLIKYEEFAGREDRENAELGKFLGELSLSLGEDFYHVVSTEEIEEAMEKGNSKFRERDPVGYENEQRELEELIKRIFSSEDP